MVLRRKRRALMNDLKYLHEDKEGDNLKSVFANLFATTLACLMFVSAVGFGLLEALK